MRAEFRQGTPISKLHSGKTSSKLSHLHQLWRKKHTFFLEEWSLRKKPRRLFQKIQLRQSISGTEIDEPSLDALLEPVAS